ncbi:hypothetical protein [Bifidobacterium miconisargentati]|uniref:hypothetical protein n=1 Tax=Bifidobacterium miconisargentati TaxID=2834437 RepID=UPI001BDBD286|nr:hypothetical protein [Bifidobacterium miconisargentati]MBW3090082.1 hypothetical protein [Bifidobacterium miconisargentati]
MMRWNHRRNEDRSLRTDGAINLGPVSGDPGVRGAEEPSSRIEPQAHMNLGPPANRDDTATMEDTARDARKTRSRHRHGCIRLAVPAVLKDRGKAMACMAVLGAFAAGGGAYLVVRSLLSDERHDARIAESVASADDQNRLRWDHAVSCAEDLLARIASSPVAGKVEVGPLEQAKTSATVPCDVEQLETLTVQVEEDFHAALDAEAEKIAESIRQTAERGDLLTDAPDSREHDELNQLVTQWRQVTIARANLESAAEAASHLKELADVVERQRDEAREQQDRAEQSESADPAPQSSGLSQPQYAPVVPQRPSGPTWRVPGESTTQRLPGKDGSL